MSKTCSSMFLDIIIHFLMLAPGLFPTTRSDAHADTVCMSYIPRPERPEIDMVNVNQNMSKIDHKEGDVLVVKCTANLDENGFLKFVIMSESNISIIGSSDRRVISTNMTIESQSGSGECMKVGEIVMQLNITPSLEGKTLACISRVVGGVDICSTQDMYCYKAGKFHFARDPNDEDASDYHFEFVFVALGLVVLFLLTGILCLMKRGAGDVIYGETVSVKDPEQAGKISSAGPGTARRKSMAQKMSISTAGKKSAASFGMKSGASFGPRSGTSSGQKSGVTKRTDTPDTRSMISRSS